MEAIEQLYNHRWISRSEYTVLRASMLAMHPSEPSARPHGTLNGEHKAGHADLSEVAFAFDDDAVAEITKSFATSRGPQRCSTCHQYRKQHKCTGIPCPSPSSCGSPRLHKLGKGGKKGCGAKAKTSRAKSQKEKQSGKGKGRGKAKPSGKGKGRGKASAKGKGKEKGRGRGRGKEKASLMAEESAARMGGGEREKENAKGRGGKGGRKGKKDEAGVAMAMAVAMEVEEVDEEREEAERKGVDEIPVLGMPVAFSAPGMVGTDVSVGSWTGGSGEGSAFHAFGGMGLGSMSLGMGMDMVPKTPERRPGSVIPMDSPSDLLLSLPSGVDLHSLHDILLQTPPSAVPLRVQTRSSTKKRRQLLAAIGAASSSTSTTSSSSSATSSTSSTTSSTTSAPGSHPPPPALPSLLSPSGSSSSGHRSRNKALRFDDMSIADFLISADDA